MNTEPSNQAAAPTPPTVKLRIARKLFPHRFCAYPQVDWDHQETFATEVTVKLAWADRLRIFCSGWLSVRTRSVLEHKVGRNHTNGSFHVPAPNWLEPIV